MVNTKACTVFLTGSSGFVGQRLSECIANKKEFSLRITTRTLQQKPFDRRITVCAPRAISGETAWHDALKGCEVVIHAAARVHVMDEKEKDPLKKFREINVDGTLNLARQSAQLGVKRFIFISSIKVNGEFTLPEQMFSPEDPPKPIDAYGISKYEAEQGLKLLAAETGMEVVIIRPPIVYGSGVKGNFPKMIRWLETGIPLPLKSVKNKRSLVSLENLVSLIITCIDHPQAAQQVFLVSDGTDLSTADLLQKVGNALNKPVRLFSFPYSLLKCLAFVLGQGAIFQRLCGSLQLDISKTCKTLGWKPSSDVDKSLGETVQAYLQGKIAS